MSELSDGLRSWKEKLDDIVQVACHIKNADDIQTACNLWNNAFKRITLLWENESYKQDVKDPLDVSNAQKEKEIDQKNVTFLANVSNAHEEKEILNENEEEMNENEEEINENTIEVKLEDQTDGTGNLKQEKDEECNNESKAEVQSVHLMISTEPMMAKSTPNKKSASIRRASSVHPCTLCHKEFYTAMALRKHLASHKRKGGGKDALPDASSGGKGKFPWDERPFKCSQCSSSFKSRGNLMRHKATHTGDKPWECTVCGKSYTEKRSLTVHMRTHTGERPYGCTICHKRFGQSGVLQTHMLTHTNKFAHLCDICGRSFRQRPQLVIHRRRHQGIRPFACSECESKFTTKGDFDRHLRTHTGERPYPCDVCGSSFARAQTLREHKNRHFNYKPYICKICGKNFYELSTCSRHIKSIHCREDGKTLAAGRSESLYQDNVKEQIHIEQGSEEDNSILIEGSVPESDELASMKKEDRMKFLDVHAEKIEVVNLTDHEEKNFLDGSKMACRDCGAVFSSYRGLTAHGRYCKHKKKSETFQEPNPRLSTKITARLPGVPVTQWLAEHTAGYDNINQEEENAERPPRNLEPKTEPTEETSESIEYVQEIEDENVGHAVTIDEDGSITTIPLSQLAPIHIQLENEYMVVLSDSTRVEADRGTASFTASEIPQVEIEEDPGGIDEGDSAEPGITLVLNP